MAHVDSRRGPLDGLLDQLLDVEPGRGSHTTIPTGYSPLDDVLQGGMRTGDLLILGGRPGSGKTAMAMQWAHHAAVAGYPVLIASLEHDPSDLLERLLLLEVGAVPRTQRPDAREVRQALAEVFEGRGTWEDAIAASPRLADARERIDAISGNLHLLCGSDIDVATIRYTADDLGPGPKLVVIDYLQKVADHSHGHDPESVTRDAKSLALDTNAAVLGISSTDQQGLTTRRVRLSHLRGSAAIAYEADVALLLDEKVNAISRVHTDFDDVRRRSFLEQSIVAVEKHRRGVSGMAMEFRHELAFSRFDPDGGIVAERMDESVPEPA